MNYGRGWISNEDTGSNESYYLKISKWYWLISPKEYDLLKHSNLVCIYEDGKISSSYEIGAVDGVQTSQKVILIC